MGHYKINDQTSVILLMRHHRIRSQLIRYIILDKIGSSKDGEEGNK